MYDCGMKIILTVIDKVNHKEFEKLFTELPATRRFIMRCKHSNKLKVVAQRGYWSDEDYEYANGRRNN